MRRRPILRFATSLVASFLWASTLSAQSAQAARSQDEGSFSLMRNGERIGREQFSIRERSGADGRGLEFRAETAVGSVRSAYRLQVDSTGLPLQYAVEIRTGTDVTLRLGGQRVRGRFTTLARGSKGEAAREYMFSGGTYVLDEGAVHQYAALLAACRGQTPGTTSVLQVLAPLENRQGTVRVVLETTEDVVTIAGVRREASRWRIVPSQGVPRLAWTDSEGRLLRVHVPSQSFEAIRDDVPR